MLFNSDNISIGDRVKASTRGKPFHNKWATVSEVHGQLIWVVFDFDGGFRFLKYSEISEKGLVYSIHDDDLQQPQ